MKRRCTAIYSECGPYLLVCPPSDFYFSVCARVDAEFPFFNGFEVLCDFLVSFEVVSCISILVGPFILSRWGSAEDDLVHVDSRSSNTFVASKKVALFRARGRNDRRAVDDRAYANDRPCY